MEKKRLDSRVGLLSNSIGMNIFFSIPRHTEENGQAKINNKTILNYLKKRLHEAKGRCVEELLGVLWTSDATKRGINETSFSLAFRTEAVIPTKRSIPNLTVPADRK